MDVEGVVCVVTGASSGIGEAAARLLGERGAKVVLAARRLDRLRALSAEIPGSFAVRTDVTVSDDVEQLVASTLEHFGSLGVIVNNAGQGLHVPVEHLRASDLRAVFELNVVAPLTLMQAALPSLRASGVSSVVNVSSATTLRIFPGLGGYAATKSALNTLSTTARREWADDGVTVSLVYPSVTATEFHQHLRAGQIVSGPWSQVPDAPELVALAVLFAIEQGYEHVIVADPPVAVTLGAEGATALRTR